MGRRASGAPHPGRRRDPRQGPPRARRSGPGRRLRRADRCRGWSRGRWPAPRRCGRPGTSCRRSEGSPTVEGSPAARPGRSRVGGAWPGTGGPAVRPRPRRHRPSRCGPRATSRSRRAPGGEAASSSSRGRRRRRRPRRPPSHTGAASSRPVPQRSGRPAARPRRPTREWACPRGRRRAAAGSRWRRARRPRWPGRPPGQARARGPSERPGGESPGARRRPPAAPGWRRRRGPRPRWVACRGWRPAGPGSPGSSPRRRRRPWGRRRRPSIVQHAQKRPGPPRPVRWRGRRPRGAVHRRPPRARRGCPPGFGPCRAPRHRPWPRSGRHALSGAPASVVCPGRGSRPKWRSPRRRRPERAQCCCPGAGTAGWSAATSASPRCPDRASGDRRTA